MIGIFLGILIIQTGTEAAQVLNDTVKGLQPSAVATVDAARTLVETRLPELTAQIEKTVAMLEQQVTTVGTDATALITQYQEVGQTAQARLEQTEGAIAAFESATVEAKAAIETINASIQQTLPNLMVDVANAADNANKVIAQIGDEVTTLSGKLNALSDEGSLALTTATETFANANTTLEAVTQAMDTAPPMENPSITTSRAAGTASSAACPSAIQEGSIFHDRVRYRTSANPASGTRGARRSTNHSIVGLQFPGRGRALPPFTHITITSDPGRTTRMCAPVAREISCIWRG